jgi:hypothetical protein
MPGRKRTDVAVIFDDTSLRWSWRVLNARVRAESVWPYLGHVAALNAANRLVRSLGGRHSALVYMRRAPDSTLSVISINECRELDNLALAIIRGS